MSTGAERINLPPKPFLYTIDQVAFLLSLTEDYMHRKLIHYEGRSVGAASRDVMVARNIAPEGTKPEWRIAERELIKFMRFKGYKYRERGYVE